MSNLNVSEETGQLQHALQIMNMLRMPSLGSGRVYKCLGWLRALPPIEKRWAVPTDDETTLESRAHLLESSLKS